MKLTPKYTVSYKGVFRKAGVAFDIDDTDAETMAAHGTLERSETPEMPVEPEKPARRGGRPRKAVSA